MHGVVHAEFRQHAMAVVGHETWKRLLRDAGLAAEAPRLTGRYPDEDLMASVRLLATATDATQERVLRDFGRALFDGLIAAYGPLLSPSWRTLDLVEHTERVVHRAVRLQDRDARPPELEAVRTSPREARVVYTSKRGLCQLAHGLLSGAAAHYGDRVEIEQPRCMHRGDGRCELVVRLVG